MSGNGTENTRYGHLFLGANKHGGGFNGAVGVCYLVSQSLANTHIDTLIC